MPLPSDLVLTLLGIYTEGMTHLQILPKMFIAALFVAAKKFELPKCPSSGEWLNKLLSNDIIHCDSIIQQNKV